MYVLEALTQSTRGNIGAQVVVGYQGETQLY
jgi:hypothetical protein